MRSLLKTTIVFLAFSIAQAADYPIIVQNGDSNSFYPPIPAGPVISDDLDQKPHQVVIVGAGLAGMSSAIYLTDQGFKVLLLEKEHTLGGLAASEERNSHVFDRGAAYWTDAYKEEQQILQHIGLGDFNKMFPIPDPIDSYFVRGQYYSDIWTDKTLEKLPASFALFKYELEQSNYDNLIPDQPLEEFSHYGGKMDLDRLSARAWIERMPQSLAKRLKNFKMAIKQKDDDGAQLDPQLLLEQRKQKGAQIYARYLQEKQAGKLPGASGMQDVVELMDLYCRSALGNASEYISAMAFANFYISEIITRYTTPYGTGVASHNMQVMLDERPGLAPYRTDATVIGIFDHGKDTEVRYIYGNQVHSVRADYVIYAGQLKMAPKLIQGFSQARPNQAQLMSDLGYANYSVHNVFLDGHPYRASYDTWVHQADYSDEDFTDFILGRWVDPSIKGYEGYRDFKNDPPDRDGIITIYDPLSQQWLDKPYDVAEAEQIARSAVDRLQKVFSQLSPDLWHGPLEIIRVETNRWPFSVHIAEPGHYLHKAKILRKHFGRIYFAHNNLGTPAFEEALFRGHCAADNILLKVQHGFKRESWSRCPIDP